MMQNQIWLFEILIFHHLYDLWKELLNFINFYNPTRGKHKITTSIGVFLV